MLSIVFESGRVRDWHVGEKSPVEYGMVSFVEEIQIDGDELEHVKSFFTNSGFIPKGRVIRIFGDMAKIIVGNIFN